MSISSSKNLGFTLTANRGIEIARPEADIVLLNSDTEVTPGWLEALARCAGTDPAIGTVTPFSNNAEICSLPRFCENNAWPPDRDPALMVRALELAAVPTYPELPTGVGFCLYIRRALIKAIGALDPVFGVGYGEENDLCMRAAAAGWRNVLCEDAFVMHLGAGSFGDRRGDLVERNMRILLERHPHYLDLVRSYIAADPLRPIREFAASHYRILTGRLPGVLHVVHDGGGGVEYHVRSLSAASGNAFRHYSLSAVGDDWHLEEYEEDATRRYDFRRLPGETWSDFLRGICARFSVDMVHLHNISGCRDGLIDALVEAGIPFGYTVHDLDLACPTIALLDASGNYCGAATDISVCDACLDAQDRFAGLDIAEWRRKHGNLLDRAAFVIAPSEWAAGVLRRYFPQRRVEMIPHGSATGMTRSDAVRDPVAFSDDGRPVIAVLGAIGPDKGSRRLERLVELTRKRALPVRWVLIGYLDRRREPCQSDDGIFTMHGPYDSCMLPQLLDHYRVRLVAYPSVCPETFSFTLSEAWAAGRPVVVPPMGALAERVAATGAGFVLSDDEWLSEERMLDRVASLLAVENRTALEAAAARAGAVQQPAALAAMAERTASVYNDALRCATPATPGRPIAAGRCLAALGYIPWHAPRASPPPVEASSAVPSPIARFARAALRVRHTLPGRVLYRLAPKTWIAALKARLPS